MTVAATTATANVPTNFSSAAPAASTVEATTTTSSNALSTLSNNFNDFLNLLMTQLKNQDPSFTDGFQPVHERAGSVLER